MNKLPVIALATTGVVAAATFAYHRIHENIIVKRFPDHDPKHVKERYRVFMKDVLAGKWNDVDFDSKTAEEMDEIFSKNYLFIK